MPGRPTVAPARRQPTDQPGLDTVTKPSGPVMAGKRTDTSPATLANPPAAVLTMVGSILRHWPAGVR